MGYILVPITKSRVTDKTDPVYRKDDDVMSCKVYHENFTMWTIYKDERMLDGDLVFESESHDAAVKELTRLRLSCSNGVCED